MGLEVKYGDGFDLIYLILVIINYMFVDIILLPSLFSYFS
jgi:hypothetical protein